MRFRFDHTLAFHRRCALYIVLGAAGAMLIGAVYIRFVQLEQLVEGQRGAEADASFVGLRMDRELEAIRAERDDERATFEERLRALTERQSDSDERAKVSVARSPFSIEAVLPSIVELICIDNTDRETYYTGSGTVIERKGLIITNQHILVSDDGSLIRYCGVGFTGDLQDPPKIEYVATTVAMHEENDLALLKIVEHLEGKALPSSFQAIDLAGAKAAATELNLGDPIYIGGYPGIGAETFTFTQGVVSGRVGDGLIKTSALIDSGTSGGAAFDGNGRFVGVPTAAARGDIGGSLGYLIGANVVEKFMEQYAAGKNALPPAK